MGEPADRETALWVLRRLREAGYQALFAGGAVRDMLLGLPSSDYDVATDARPDDVRQLFRHVLLLGAKFGVAMVIHRRRKVEVTTFRTDLNYADGRRPEGVVFSTPEQDARRRDFTINGMFYDPLREEVIDYVGGREDLEAGIVRTIGDPAERFAEDYLRMIRAVRFVVRLGFTIDDATAEAVRQFAPRISGISGERIFEELSKMLTRPTAAEAMRKMQELGLARNVLPELFAEDGLWDRAVGRVEAVADEEDLVVAMGALLLELPARAIRKATRRWGASNEVRNAVCWLAAHRTDWQRAETMSLADLKRLIAEEHFARLLKLWQLEERRETGAAARTEAAEARAATIPPDRIQPPPLVTGADLMAMGLPEGPELGRILRKLYEAQLNEELTERRQALEAAQAMIRECSGER